MNKKAAIIYSITLGFILFTVFGCNDKAIDPGGGQSGRRDYEWTIDTINYPYKTLFKIHGSSPDDIWATANGGEQERNLFHYDGSKWRNDEYLLAAAPYAVWSYSKDNAYMAFNSGGDYGVWHFNGAGWMEDTIFTINGENRIYLDNMWGESTNSLFAFGAYPDSHGLIKNSVIVHYSDGNWTMLNTAGIYGLVENLFRDRYDNKVYLQTISAGWHAYDSSYIYEYSEGKYTKLYGNIWTKGLTGDISLINGIVYFVLGKEIAKRVKGKFETVFTVDNPEFYQKIWGRNPSDIFLFMLDGIVHYNGFDMQYLVRFSKQPSQIWGAVLFEKEVFFLVHENSTGLSLIYHGKLK